MGLVPNILPFPRGKTLGDGVCDLSSTFGQEYWGQTYEDFDRYAFSNSPKAHVIRLRAVQCNQSGGLDFSTDTLAVLDSAGEKISDAGGAGIDGTQIVKPVDRAMNGATVSQYDVCYVVDKGVAIAAVAGTDAAGNDSAIAVGDPLCCFGNGGVPELRKAASSKMVVALALEAVQSGANAAGKKVLVLDEPYLMQ